MSRRNALRFRPTLDPLEGRIALSPLPHVPVAEASRERARRPVLTPTTYARVMGEVDRAFDEYKGRNEVPRAIADFASDVFSSWGSPDGSPAPDAGGSVPRTSGKGDGVTLDRGLRKAVDQLPFGRARIEPLIARSWGDGGMTPGNANPYRDRLKAMIRRQLAADLRAGEFSWDGIRPLSSTHPKGPGR